MKKYLLPKDGSFYKANLHCHSTVSDGKLTPAEIKDAYMAKGYSVVAYTDHDILIPHDELSDENFLALHGYEMESGDQRLDAKHRKTCHVCLIAMKPDNLTQVCYHRTKYMIGHGEEYRHLARFDESQPDFEREYTHACINEIIKTGRKNGFFVTYNHPAWSLEDRRDYGGYKGMHAMEIRNYSSCTLGFAEYNPAVYDDMLRMGKRIFCIGTDDNHDKYPIGHPKCDSFGAFTVIKAPSLAYTDITDALAAGHFYASQAPQIKELYFEDGKLFVKTSACENITMTTGTRKARNLAREKGKTLTHGVFDVAEDDIYVRITVRDKEGKFANSNAYFTDELFK